MVRIQQGEYSLGRSIEIMKMRTSATTVTLALLVGITDAFQQLRPGDSVRAVLRHDSRPKLPQERPLSRTCITSSRKYPWRCRSITGDEAPPVSSHPIESTVMAGRSQPINGEQSSLPHDHVTLLDKVVMSITLAAMVSLFAGLVSVSGPGGWRYYLAGGICAAVSHSITTPVDVVKTRQQVDPELKEKGMIKSTMKIIKTDGVQALLAGLGPTTWGYLLEGAVKFGVYEVLKPAVRRFLAWSAAMSSVPSLNSKILGFALCGTVSGVAASAMLCPMEALRIRLVAEPDFAPGGWVEGGMKMLKYEGVGGLWKGMSAMMSKQVPYTVTKNVSFDFFTTMAYNAVKSSGQILTANMKFTIPLVSAMIASVLSCISSQPGDMLLSAVNAHEGDKSTGDFFREIWKEDGIGGFFRGMRARFLHVGLIVTVQLLIYDFVKRLVGIAATGSV